MGILHPTRKLTDPLGHEWEIYVSRIESARSRLYRELMSVVRVVGLREERPDRGSAEALRVEAVTYLPHHETYLWTTTTDHIARVIEQIAAGLEQGYLARPLGAVYRGGS